MVPFLSVTVAIPVSICTNNSPQGLYIWFGFRFMLVVGFRSSKPAAACFGIFYPDAWCLIIYMCTLTPAQSF